MISYDSQILQLSYDPEIRSVVMRWNGYSNKGDFRSANEAVLEKIVSNRSDQLLADIQFMSIISIPDQIWLYQDWLPRAMMAGLKRVAIVESEDMFNRLSVDNVVQKINNQLTVQYFHTVLSARNWLKRTS